MHAGDLIHMLRESGTGESKLARAEEHMRGLGVIPEECDGGSLLDAMEANGGWPEGTAAKARAILEGPPKAPEAKGPEKQDLAAEVARLKALLASHGLDPDAPACATPTPEPPPPPQPKRGPGRPRKQAASPYTEIAPDAGEE